MNAETTVVATIDMCNRCYQAELEHQMNCMAKKDKDDSYECKHPPIECKHVQKATP